MTTFSVGDDYRVDETSQVVLQVLRDRQEPVSTGDLRRQSGREQNQVIRYRLENHLVPAGLVELAGTRETPGDGPDADLWSITAEGREWLDDHTEDITRAVDAARAVESLRRTRERLDEVGDDVEEMHGRMDGWQETMTSRGKRISNLESRFDNLKGDVVEEADGAHNRAREAKSAAESAESAAVEAVEEVEAVRDDLDELGGRVDELEEVVADLRDDVDRHESWLGELTEKVEQAGDAISDVRETAREALREARLSLWKRVFRRFR